GADLWYRSGHDAESVPTKREAGAARAGHPNPAQGDNPHRDDPDRNDAGKHHVQKNTTLTNDSPRNEPHRNGTDRGVPGGDDVERESRTADQPANSRPTLSTKRSIANGLRK
ncbi:MAG: hypothetical protein RIS70_1261, partial [Planctomycetota bacterium]